MPFSTKTLLVTGAGASADLKFPVGNKLKNEIRSLTNVDWDGYQFTGNREFGYLLQDLSRTHFEHNIGPVIEACRHIHASVTLSGSIDQFLSSHQEDRAVVLVSKLAIAYVIILAERESHLNEELLGAGHDDFYQLRDTYFPRLWARLQNGLSVNDWTEYFENVRILTFNYDRSLEKFLLMALTRFCRVKRDEATAFVDSLPIQHVYGSLGKLGPQSAGYCPYGADRHSVVHASDRILTFSETVDDKIKSDIRDYVRWSDRIVFLGFSFANVNVDLFPSFDGPGKEIYGTSFGMSAQNKKFAMQKLNLKLDRQLTRSILYDVMQQNCLTILNCNFEELRLPKFLRGFSTICIASLRRQSARFRRYSS